MKARAKEWVSFKFVVVARTIVSIKARSLRSHTSR